MGRLIHDEKKVITPPGPDPRKVHDLNRCSNMCPKAGTPVVLSGVSMVYRDGRVAKLNTGAYLIAVFAFGVASMKAMDRVFDDGSRTTSNSAPPVVRRYLRLRWSWCGTRFPLRHLKARIETSMYRDWRLLQEYLNVIINRRWHTFTWYLRKDHRYVSSACTGRNRGTLPTPPKRMPRSI
jgi:hypothetical protein